MLPAPPLTPLAARVVQNGAFATVSRGSLGAVRANPRELSSSQWRNAILDAVTRQWCRIPPLESNYLNVLTSRRGMETLAGNDDDGSGDNSSSETEGAGAAGGGGGGGGRERVGGSRGGFVLRQPVLLGDERVRNAIDMRKPRVPMALARLRKVMHLLSLDLIACTTSVPCAPVGKTTTDRLAHFFRTLLHCGEIILATIRFTYYEREGIY